MKINGSKQYHRYGADGGGNIEKKKAWRYLS